MINFLEQVLKVGRIKNLERISNISAAYNVFGSFSDNELVNTIIKYILVGGSVGILFVMSGYFLSKLGFSFVASTLLSYGITAPISYFAQRTLVFKSKGKILPQILKFFISGWLLFIGSKLIQLVLSSPGINSQLFLWAVISLSNFFSYKLYVFRMRDS